MKIALSLLLASVFAAAPPSGKAATASQTPPPQSSATSATTPDLALKELLIQVQAIAQKSDADVARLRIDKWKADSASKQEAQASADSIRRNLTSAVPDLLQRIQASPGSLNANFRLYRNLNALYDTFSALAESTGAFGPSDQYHSISADVSQLDQLRRQIAERVDMLAVANDAELARLRARGATTTSAKPAAKKVVVDDEQPKSKKKPKTSQSQPQPSQ